MYQSTKFDMSTINSRIQSRQSKRSSSVKTQELIKKDHNYYRGNFNLWDRPTIINKKIYQFYHVYNEQNGQIEEKAKQLEESDRKLEFNCKKDFVINFREKELIKLRERKLERKALQYESCQQVDLSDDDKEFEEIANDEQKCKKLIYKKGFKVNFSNRAPHLWNNMTKQTQKYIDQSDEKAIELINKNFDKQQQLKEEQNKKAIEKHDELRQAFKQRHLQNYLYEKQFSAQNQLTQTQSNANLLTANNNNNNTEEELNKMNDPDYFPCRYKNSELILTKTRNFSATQSNMHAKRLAQPKEYRFSQAFLHSHSDYKGLLIGELDIRKATQTDNCFVKTVLPSSVAQKALLEQQQNLETTMRPKTALPDLNLKTKTNYYKLKDLVIPTKTLDDFNKEHKEEEREKILNDIDQFDKKCKSNKKGLGFAQSVFLEASNLINTDGLNKLREERKMREMVKNELKAIK